MKFLSSPWNVILIILFLSAVLFLPFLGSVPLFDWDENIFAESAREMLVTGNFYKIQSNYQPFEEKPPFFFWLQALSMILFGETAFAARFPNAIVGMITLVLIYLLGRKYFCNRFGIYWALAYMGSILPHFYFRTALIDPAFNLFIFSGIFTLGLLVSTNKELRFKRDRKAVLVGTLIGFAILTKGPVAFLIVFLTALVFSIYKRSFRLVSFREIILFTIPMLLVASAWFAIEVVINGPWFIKEFIEYQLYVLKQPHSGHSGPFYFHFVVLLLGCFPVSFFLFKGLRSFDNDNYLQRNIKVTLVIMMLVVLFLFSIVKTKLVHYSSLCYFPVSFLAAYVLIKVEGKRIFYGNLFRSLILITGLLFGSLFIAVFYLLDHKEQFLEEYGEYIKDPFAIGNLSANFTVAGWDYLAGPVLIAGVLLFAILFKRNFQAAVLILFVSMILTVQLLSYSLVPKIEEMTQGAAVRFYTEKGKEDAYMLPYGFKSFAYLFYGKKMPGYNPESLDESWLLTGSVDKPVYIIAKDYPKRIQALDAYSDLQLLYRENGYVFYKRPVPAQ